ncbi:hypothetical protein PN450_11060 [Dolichospermum lemmermannii CS-548]|uniref:hypothetical protein n=1 Tax=Dolichospermum lemmermannii TaxID=54295 RepID=UPI00232CE00F|nr:hypothetical protein [Dolichospermum lemmermannii]MDB9437322.1 hypothetical protein [Dolichospermum lemmermannii CS-548]
MPIVESALIIKGAMAITHWLTAHGTTAMAAKAGAIVANSVATQGLASTATLVAGIATTASLSVGCILWTTDRLKLASESLQAMQDGDTTRMVEKLAQLAIKLDIDCDMLPDAVQDMLCKQANFSYEDAHKVAKVIHAYEKKIDREMNKKGKKRK